MRPRLGHQRALPTRGRKSMEAMESVQGTWKTDDKVAWAKCEWWAWPDRTPPEMATLTPKIREVDIVLVSKTKASRKMIPNLFTLMSTGILVAEIRFCTEMPVNEMHVPTKQLHRIQITCSRAEGFQKYWQVLQFSQHNSSDQHEHATPQVVQQRHTTQRDVNWCLVLSEHAALHKPIRNRK